jgi:hypothetical protein
MANVSFEVLIKDAPNTTPPYLVTDYVPVIRDGVTRHILGSNLIKTDLSNTTFADGSGNFTFSGWVANKVKTVTKTGNYSVLVTDSGSYFNNIGATVGINLTLPVAAAGLVYGFVSYTSQVLRIIRNGSDLIKNGVGFSETNLGSSSPYSSLILQAHGAGIWVVTSVVGTWYSDLISPERGNLVFTTSAPVVLDNRIISPGRVDLVFTTSIPDRTP